MNKKNRNSYLKGLILCAVAIRPDLSKNKEYLYDYVKKLAQKNLNFTHDKYLLSRIHCNAIDLVKRNLLFLK